MKYILIIFFFIGVIAYFLQYNKRSKPYDQKQNLIIQIGNSVGEKYNLQLSSYGGKFDNGIKIMAISYSRYGSTLDVYESRELIVKCANDILNEVNKNPDIKSYLNTYPFTISNLDIDIFNHDEQNGDIVAPFIALTSSWEGQIIYRTQTKGSYELKNVKEETYEEAIKILKEQHLL